MDLIQLRERLPRHVLKARARHSDADRRAWEAYLRDEAERKAIAADVHVCFLAWRRLYEAIQALESWRRFNMAWPVSLYYAIDGGGDVRIASHFDAFRLKPLVRPRRQVGIARMFEAITAALAEKVAPESLLLIVEEDRRATRELPLKALKGMMAAHQLDYVRLCGRERCRGRPWERLYAAAWDGEDFLLPKTYWAHQCYVTRLDAALKLTEGARDEEISIRRSHALGLRAGWLETPCFRHCYTVRSRELGGKT